MRYTLEEMETAYTELTENESFKLTIIGAFIGIIPAFAFYIFMSYMGDVLLLFLVIPPAIIGLMARYVGRPYRFKVRIMVGTIALIVHMIWTVSLEQNPLVFLITPLCFAIAFHLAKIKLTDLQELSITFAEDGKIGVKKKETPTIVKSGITNT